MLFFRKGNNVTEDLCRDYHNFQATALWYSSHIKR